MRRRTASKFGVTGECNVHTRGLRRAIIHAMAADLETRLADDLEQHTEAYAELVLERIAAEVPELLADPRSRELGRTGSQALLREFGTALRHELGAIHYHAPTAALAFSRHLAREGVSLAPILRSYRLGQEVLFARAAELAVDEYADEESVRALARIGALSFRFSDGAMSDVAQEYETQRELVIRGTLAQRASTLRALLAGRAGRPGRRRARPRTPAGRRARRDRRLVDRPGTRRGGDRRGGAGVDPNPRRGSAARHDRDAGRGDDLDHPREGSSPRAAELGALLPLGVRAAIGRPAMGAEGFVATQRQADLARSVASGHDGPAVTFYDDVALATVLLRDREAARAFAAEELGALAARTRAAAELRETLSAYFANGYDQSRTADVLGVHRNTIAKRLRRAEATLGRPITRRPRELEAALTIAEVIG